MDEQPAYSIDVRVSTPTTEICYIHPMSMEKPIVIWKYNKWLLVCHYKFFDSLRHLKVYNKNHRYCISQDKNNPNIQSKITRSMFNE